MLPRLMGPMHVVVPRVLAQDLPEVAFTIDQQVVEALAPYRPHIPLRVGVGRRRRPTARSSASTAPWPTNGPTPDPTPPKPNAAPPLTPGSTPTTITGDTPHSEASHPPAASPTCQDRIASWAFSSSGVGRGMTVKNCRSGRLYGCCPCLSVMSVVSRHCRHGHIADGVRAEGAVRGTACFGDLRPFCPIIRAPGLLV